MRYSRSNLAGPLQAEEPLTGNELQEGPEDVDIAQRSSEVACDDKALREGDDKSSQPNQIERQRQVEQLGQMEQQRQNEQQQQQLHLSLLRIAQQVWASGALYRGNIYRKSAREGVGGTVALREGGIDRERKSGLGWGGDKRKRDVMCSDAAGRGRRATNTW